jgi:hypothetical protein
MSITELKWNCMNVTTRLGVSLRPRLPYTAVNNKRYLQTTKYMLSAITFTVMHQAWPESVLMSLKQ